MNAEVRAPTSASGIQRIHTEGVFYRLGNEVSRPALSVEVLLYISSAPSSRINETRVRGVSSVFVNASSRRLLPFSTKGTRARS